MDATQPAVASTGPAHDAIAASAPLAAPAAADGRRWQAVRRTGRALHGLKMLRVESGRLLPEAHALLCRVSRVQRADGRRLLGMRRHSDIGVALPRLLARGATSKASSITAQAANAARTGPSAGAASATARAAATIAATVAAAAAAAAAGRA